MRQFYIILIISFLFSGCTVINEYQDSFKLKYQHSTKTTNFNELTGELIEPLCETLDLVKLYKKRNIPIYVTDFVNVEELENHSELGFVLSSEVKTHVTNRCDHPVHALEYTKYLKMGAKGTKLLSRDLKDLKNTEINQNTYALVGTYAISQRQLMVYLKVIDLKNGIILKQSNASTVLTDEIIHLEQNNKKRFNEKAIYQPMVL